MKTIAIIPARGGSKRLPRKNLISLGEIPLIVHTINYAKANKNLIDRIVVSTDDEDIKIVAENAGVEVMTRPAELSSDTSTTVSVLKHVLYTDPVKYDNVILLQPTNPLRPFRLLAEAYSKFISGNYDSLMTVTETRQKLGKIINNRFHPFNYKMGQRSQDLKPLYFENGLLYISKVDLVLKGYLLGDRNLPYIVDHPFAKIDIDLKEDLDYAHYVFNKFLK